MRHLIIGNGPSGVIAAETIRKNAPHDEIVMLGDEPEPSYSRMAIPYLLVGNIDESGTYLRKNAGHFQHLRIEQRSGRASKIDTAARKVTLEDGGTIDYDRLLLATGSVPVKPPVAGIDHANVHHCWTLEDARNIMKLAKPGARVIQMGAGFIGCIIMEALAMRGIELTVVEMGDRMVPRMMGAGAGSMIKQWCEKKGVKVFTGTSVQAIGDGIGAPMKVRLSNGEALDADLVISATGVKPNIGFLQGSGIDIGRGILVDSAMQTNVPGVYAAGDCAEAFDFASGKTVVSAIQPNAADQAYCAGMNMAGKNLRKFDVTTINVLDTLGLISTSFGSWEGVPNGEKIELADTGNFKYLELAFDGDVLIGSNSVGHTDHVGVMRGLIQQRVKLGDWKQKLIEDPTRLMEAYIACSQQQHAWQRA
ncbi:Pyridine nucleotide-disulphide oxidoreductase [Noviherbaspirillum humi]|uniref:Pyridine nucleotide-disulphide oxidoreductase n=1 Tax=Noviherbaspirillum humi TaxID=1688639 RepID=A0A239DHF1_9BURK|nr:FAD-dependent oxidoreductase [Noviherbaspirillum humi]SNS31143.1 Pyridine nucleotide-disulphide oxidoreductase [Noviherbaspirillum humi]